MFFFFAPFCWKQKYERKNEIKELFSFNNSHCFLVRFVVGKIENEKKNFFFGKQKDKNGGGKTKAHPLFMCCDNVFIIFFFFVSGK